MYTLLSASVLGFDLVRRPGGGAVASILVDALSVTPDDLPLLARTRSLGHLTGDDRLEVERAAEGPPMVAAMGQMSRLVAAGQVSEALQLLESAPLAGLPELLGCVRSEIFDWAHPAAGGPDPAAVAAVEVVCDAVVAAYHAPHLGKELREHLVDPWAVARRLLPRRTPDLGPCHAELTALLDALAALDAAGWHRLQAVGTQVRGQGSWAPAMHSATWSVHLSGRVREGAGAQLRAVQVLSGAPVPEGGAARGLWNLVSGAVQASVATDLVDDETAQRLRIPVLAALGLV
jgi:hypothetical protein